MVDAQPARRITFVPPAIVSGAIFVLALTIVLTIVGAAKMQLPGPPQRTSGGVDNVAPVMTTALVPGYGALWGSWVAPLNGQSDAQAVASFETTVQRRLDIVHQYHAWDDSWPTATEYSWASGGRIVFGNASPRQKSGAVLSWTAIANGSQDSTINALAGRLKAFGHQLFFSFDEEPEDRYHSNPSVYTMASYVAAYQHIHNLFVADGATNVVWVWNVSGYSGDESIYPHLYPGDSYVDWMGWDPYNWFNCSVNTTNVWQSFDAIVAPFYNWLSGGGLSSGSAVKPFMLAEYGTVENTGAPTKGQWFTSEVSDLPSRPKIKAVVYFDQNKDCNWPITTSSGSISGFTAAGLNCYVDRSQPCGVPTPVSTPPPVSPPPSPVRSPSPSPVRSPGSSPAPSPVHSPLPTHHPSPSPSHSSQPPAGASPVGQATPVAPDKTASIPTHSDDGLTGWLRGHEYVLPIALVVLVVGGLWTQHLTSGGRPR